MTGREIQSYFVCRVWLPDASYTRPTLRWLQGAFWDAFREDRFNKVGRYSRKNDCDNFARAYAQLAQDCHAMSTGRDAEGLAVGEVFYITRKGEGHAIVCAFTDQGRKFIEPQTGRVIDLTENELLSCTFVRF
jgi:hypothetical protein